MRNTSKFTRTLIALAMLSIPLCTPLQATIIQTYNDRTTWQAATSGQSDIDFSDLTLGNGGTYTLYTTSAGLTWGGVNFTGVTGSGGYYMVASNPGGSDSFGTGNLLRGPAYWQGGYIELLFGANVTSIALDLMTMTPKGASISLVVDGVSVGGAIATSTGSPTFWGATADSPITSLRVYLSMSGSGSDTQAMIDNIAFGQAGPPPGSETPEAATLFYVGGGVYLIAWKKKRSLRLART